MKGTSNPANRPKRAAVWCEAAPLFKDEIIPEQFVERTDFPFKYATPAGARYSAGH